MNASAYLDNQRKSATIWRLTESNAKLLRFFFDYPELPMSGAHLKKQ